VLFPDDSVPWNDLDLEMTADSDLSHFNFDINELGDFPQMAVQPTNISYTNAHVYQQQFDQSWSQDIARETGQSFFSLDTNIHDANEYATYANGLGGHNTNSQRIEGRADALQLNDSPHSDQFSPALTQSWSAEDRELGGSSSGSSPSIGSDSGSGYKLRSLVPNIGGGNDPTFYNSSESSQSSSPLSSGPVESSRPTRSDVLMDSVTAVAVGSNLATSTALNLQQDTTAGILENVASATPNSRERRASINQAELRKSVAAALDGLQQATSNAPDDREDTIGGGLREACAISAIGLKQPMSLTSDVQRDFTEESTRNPAAFASDDLERAPSTEKNLQSDSIDLLMIPQTYKKHPVTCRRTPTLPFSQIDWELLMPILESIPHYAAATVATSKISLRQPPTPAELSSTTSPALLAPSSQSLTSEPGAYRPANTDPRTSLVPVTPTLAYKSGSSAGFSRVITALMKVMISLGSLILVALSLSLANNTSLLAAWTKSSMAVASCFSSTFRMIGRKRGLKSHPSSVNLLRLSV
jgi:hypothetical protein